MIIGDDHEVAFLHIPKCAGTSVRKQLRPLDSYENFFHGRREHESLGPIDYAHLPLRVLASHFPGEFEKIIRYRTFALIRDPHARFASSTFQRLALFGGVRRTAATADMAIREAEATMKWLEGRAHFHDPGYIHFARQVDFVEFEGRRVVHNLYPVEDLHAFGEDLTKAAGIVFDADRQENANFASPSRALSILHVAKPIYSRLTTWSQREQMLRLLRRLNLQSPDSIYSRFRGDRRIREFVETYYAADFKLRDELARKRPAPAAARQPPKQFQRA